MVSLLKIRFEKICAEIRQRNAQLLRRGSFRERKFQNIPRSHNILATKLAAKYKAKISSSSTTELEDDHYVENFFFDCDSNQTENLGALVRNAMAARKKTEEKQGELTGGKEKGETDQSGEN